MCYTNVSENRVLVKKMDLENIILDLRGISFGYGKVYIAENLNRDTILIYKPKDYEELKGCYLDNKQLYRLKSSKNALKA